MSQRSREAITIILVAAWYFGGAALLVAGYALTTALAFTAVVLVVWRWRNRSHDEYGDPQLPPIPVARLRK